MTDFQPSSEISFDEDELCFDGPDLAELTPAPVKPPRKKVAKGKAVAEPEAEAAPPVPPAPEPVATTQPDPVEAAPLAPKPATSRVATIAMTLAVLSSLISAIGVLMTSRNLVALAEERAAAAHETAAVDKLPALLARIDRLVARQEAALAARRPADPLTRNDINAAIDGLKLSLAKQEPAGGILAGVVRQGQNDLSIRIDDLRRRLEVMESKRAAAH